MRLPKWAIYGLGAVAVGCFVAVLEFGTQINGAASWAVFGLLFASLGALAYFVGKEMSPLHNVTAVLLACFCLLFFQLNRIQVLQAQDLAETPGNNRQIQRDFGEFRGEILTSDGQLVAVSQPIVDETYDYRRLYPHGELYAHSVGYVSLNFFKQGVEDVFNDDLTDNKDLVLGIDHELQLAAREALLDSNGQPRNGSVVALDPRTGDIRALWSYPSFDPEPLTSLDGSEVNAAMAEYKGSDPTNLNCTNNPDCAQAIGEIYEPGSTFKLVIASAALQSTNVTLQQPIYDRVKSFVLPGTGGNTSVTNFAGSECGGSLFDLIRQSCNAGFAQMAIEDIGAENVMTTSERYGFNSRIPIDGETDVFASAASALNDEILDDPAALGQTAIGQRAVKASPLQMALIASAVANDGKMMAPKFVAGMSESGVPNARVEPTKSNRLQKDGESPISGRTAQQLQEAMSAVVSNGTATVLQTPGIDIGAKTGTAETGEDDEVHTWVVAYGGRPGQAPELALAVLVENLPDDRSNTGGAIAGPIAKKLFETYFADAEQG